MSSPDPTSTYSIQFRRFPFAPSLFQDQSSDFPFFVSGECDFLVCLSHKKYIFGFRKNLAFDICGRNHLNRISKKVASFS